MKEPFRNAFGTKGGLFGRECANGEYRGCSGAWNCVALQYGEKCSGGRRFFKKRRMEAKPIRWNESFWKNACRVGIWKSVKLCEFRLKEFSGGIGSRSKSKRIGNERDCS